MNKDELLHWINVYDEEASSQSDETLEFDLRFRFQSNHNMTKQDRARGKLYRIFSRIPIMSNENAKFLFSKFIIKEISK